MGNPPQRTNPYKLYPGRASICCGAGGTTTTQVAAKFPPQSFEPTLPESKPQMMDAALEVDLHDLLRRQLLPEYLIPHAKPYTPRVQTLHNKRCTGGGPPGDDHPAPAVAMIPISEPKP